jgi:hypothetical protein
MDREAKAAEMYNDLFWLMVGFGVTLKTWGELSGLEKKAWRIHALKYMEWE